MSMFWVVISLCCFAGIIVHISVWKKETPIKGGEKILYNDREEPFNSIDEAAEYIFERIENRRDCFYKRPLEQIKKDLYLITGGDLEKVSSQEIWLGYQIENFEGDIDYFIEYHCQKNNHFAK